MTKSEEILARAAKYNKVQRVADSLGRMIGFKRLKPSQQVKIEEWSPNLDGTMKHIDETTGEEFSISRRFPLIIAASLAEIDERPVPFARNRAELDSNLDLLDSEGIAAGVKAMGELSAEEKVEADPIEEAKN